VLCALCDFEFKTKGKIQRENLGAFLTFGKRLHPTVMLGLFLNLFLCCDALWVAFRTFRGDANTLRGRHLGRAWKALIESSLKSC
jgi:hypothetical protein